MDREPVQSSSIAAIGYDPQTAVLEVEFTGDYAKVYRYFMVPSAVAEAFRRSPSKGRFFGANIRNAYRHEENWVR